MAHLGLVRRLASSELDCLSQSVNTKTWIDDICLKMRNFQTTGSWMSTAFKDPISVGKLFVLLNGEPTNSFSYALPLFLCIGDMGL